MTIKRKEKNGKLLTKKTKKQRTSDRSNYKEDRISNLPRDVLFHILKSLEMKDIFKTCVLSKQWKDLWKSVTDLSLHSSYFRTVADFNKFVSHILANRDASISLTNLHVFILRYSELKLLTKIMKYAVLYKVQRLVVDIACSCYLEYNKFPPSIFSSPYLLSLSISVLTYGPLMKLPQSLHMSALTILSLNSVCFTAGDNDCAEPFSSCKLLKSLLLQDCFLHHDAKMLCISNSSLSSLTLHHAFRRTYKLVLSTPNLNCFNVTGNSAICFGEVSSTCNLSFLEEGNIDVRYPPNTNWLQLFSNVKSLTLSVTAMENILSVLTYPYREEVQHPYFVKLNFLKLGSEKRISEIDVNRVVRYIIGHTQLTCVFIIRC